MNLSKNTKPLTIIICHDIEENWYRYLAEENEREWREHERELDLAREAELNPPIEEADVEYIELAVAQEVCPHACLESPGRSRDQQQ